MTTDKLQFNEENLKRIKELPYVIDRFSYRRRKTREVKVGDLGIGGENPIRVQTMTISDTQNIQATIDEAERLAKGGAELVRVTAPSQKDAECLKEIREGLFKRGCRVPLCADIHFTPKAALLACEFVEKVRINPGNFADKKIFAQRYYTKDEYQEELDRIHEKFTPLVFRAKELGRALRIGTNHGSLSDRIMNRYGDTPMGMVESALEFVEICRMHGFHDLVISMKASNPKVMIQAYRLLAARMDELKFDYPIHLGVTEAGAGEDGRIKSSVGIGSLLEDGIGDTIRVSLTEDSIHEIPVCYELIRRFTPRREDPGLKDKKLNAEKLSLVSTHRSPQRAELRREAELSPYFYEKRRSAHLTFGPWALGGEETTRIQLALKDMDGGANLKELKDVLGLERDFDPTKGTPDPAVFKNTLRAELIEVPLNGVALKAAAANIKMFRGFLKALQPWGVGASLVLALPSMDEEFLSLIEAGDLVRLGFENGQEDEAAWVKKTSGFLKSLAGKNARLQWILDENHSPSWAQKKLGENPDALVELMLSALKLSREYGFKEILAGFQMRNPIAAYRLLADQLLREKIDLPLALVEPLDCPLTDPELRGATVIGSLLCDGLGDLIVLRGSERPARASVRLAYNVLQATGNRISKTEFISCPSCGRTLFNLEETTDRIRQKLGHLRGLKLAIMGCIVNGPGEMADAHFGYVGAGPGRINLYVGKECVQKNIPSAEADQRLIDLVRDHGMWVDP